MYRRAVIILGKAIARLLKIFGSSATALPGLIILKLYPDFLRETIGKEQEKVIVVTGTNGKTTTAHLLTHLLKKSGHMVFHNAEGSNMERGIASEILKNNKQFDFYIIEADEGSFPRILKELKPKTVVLLNIFRDQLDRYGEINTLMNKWTAALKENLPEKIIFNADDPNITWIINSLDAPSDGYGVEFSDKRIVKSADRVFCPKCNGILNYKNSEFTCEDCGFKKMKTEYVLKENSQLSFNNEPIGAPLVGKYNYYNLAAACTVFKILIRSSKATFEQLFSNFHPAFGRFEKINYKDNFFYVILSKNPAGMNSVIQTLNEDLKPDNLMLSLNDKIADGEDVSWIYDAEFEELIASQLLLSGTRAYDLALRLKIAGVTVNTLDIQTDMQKAFEEFARRVEKSKVSAIIATYTCLLELQKIMYGRKLIKRVM